MGEPKPPTPPPTKMPYTEVRKPDPPEANQVMTGSDPQTEAWRAGLRAQEKQKQAARGSSPPEASEVMVAEKGSADPEIEKLRAGLRAEAKKREAAAKGEAGTSETRESYQKRVHAEAVKRLHEEQHPETAEHAQAGYLQHNKEQVHLLDMMRVLGRFEDTAKSHCGNLGQGQQLQEFVTTAKEGRQVKGELLLSIPGLSEELRRALVEAATEYMAAKEKSEEFRRAVDAECKAMKSRHGDAVMDAWARQGDAGYVEGQGVPEGGEVVGASEETIFVQPPPAKRSGLMARAGAWLKQIRGK